MLIAPVFSFFSEIKRRPKAAQMTPQTHPPEGLIGLRPGSLGGELAGRRRFVWLHFALLTSLHNRCKVNFGKLEVFPRTLGKYYQLSSWPRSSASTTKLDVSQCSQLRFQISGPCACSASVGLLFFFPLLGSVALACTPCCHMFSSDKVMDVRTLGD